MASATDKPLRKLGELLQEKQEPLVLEVYLLERRFAKKINVAAAQERSVNAHHHQENSKRSVSDTLKRIKSLRLYLKILKAVSKILSINQTKISHDAETFSSCCESNAKKPRKITKRDQNSATAGANLAPKAHNYGVSEAFEDVQEKPPNGPNIVQKDQEISTDEGDSKLHRVNTNIQTRRQSHRHNSISKLENITEDMILSASLSHMLVQSVEAKGLSELKASHFFQMLKSKGILQQTKQLLFDRVWEISTHVSCSYDEAQRRNAEMLGPEEVNELIFEKLDQWENQEGDETNINCLLAADYHNSIEEWMDFEPQKQDIAIDIGDTIFEDIRKEIVSEMIQMII